MLRTGLVNLRLGRQMRVSGGKAAVSNPKPTMSNIRSRRASAACRRYRSTQAPARPPYAVLGHISHGPTMPCHDTTSRCPVRLLALDVSTSRVTRMLDGSELTLYSS